MKKESANARQERMTAANRLIAKHPVLPEHITPKKKPAVRRVVTPAMELRVEVAKVS